MPHAGSTWTSRRSHLTPALTADGSTLAMPIDERFALHNVLFNEDSQRVVTAMFRDEFVRLYKARERLPLAYNVFFGDGSKIKGPNTTEEKQRATLSFPEIVRESKRSDPHHVADPDYNDPGYHFSIIIKTLSWHVNEHQIPANRTWLMMVS